MKSEQSSKDVHAGKYYKDHKKVEKVDKPKDVSSSGYYEGRGSKKESFTQKVIQKINKKGQDEEEIKEEKRKEETSQEAFRRGYSQMVATSKTYTRLQQNLSDCKEERTEGEERD